MLLLAVCVYENERIDSVDRLGKMAANPNW